MTDTESNLTHFLDAWRHQGILLQLAGEMDAKGEHRHPGELFRWCLLVVREGSMHVGTADREITLEAPTSCLLPPGVTWRRLPTTHPTRSAQFWFQVHSPPGKPNPFLQLLLPQAVQPRSLDNFNSSINQLLELFENWKPRDPIRACRANNQFGEVLLNHLINGFQTVYSVAPPTTPDWLRAGIGNVVATAKRHHWKVEALAEMLGVTRQQLERACKRYYQSTPSKLMRKERLAFAVNGLSSGRWKSVEEAAFDMGYPNPRMFWRHCVDETGRSPSNWLREANSQTEFHSKNTKQ